MIFFLKEANHRDLIPVVALNMAYDTTLTMTGRLG